MPGAVSLAQRQYYANPQNAFWTLMGTLIGAGPDLPYARRIARLRMRRIAVWDVLQSCVRPGSLDGDIDPRSLKPNDFAGFFAHHAQIRAVFCNGGTAYTCYRRLVLPTLVGKAAGLPLLRLPSTSPAHAALTRTQKLARWRAILGY
jgi:hypoxanthine-DNA glycosylase